MLSLKRCVKSRRSEERTSSVDKVGYKRKQINREIITQSVHGCRRGSSPLIGMLMIRALAHLVWMSKRPWARDLNPTRSRGNSV